MSVGFVRGIVGVAALALVGACSDGTGAGADVATLRVQITDAPSVEFDSAVVYIGAVTVHPAEGNPIVVTDDGGRFDLLDLQNGVTAELGAVDVDPGIYTELRLIVDSANVGLADPFAFDDGTTERALKVPSGSSSGIKVKLRSGDDDDGAGGVMIAPGETVLVVDFDVQQNFKIQGNPNTPAGLKGVLFTPVLRAVVRDVAGSIAGTVTSSADDSPLAGLTVRATLQGTPPGETVEALAVTGDDGTYVIRFLAPGTYTVSVDSFSAAAQNVTVAESEDVTGVDFSGTST